jgi:hypothetical protein
MTQTAALVKLAGRSEQEVAEDIASEVDHFLYKKLNAIQDTYLAMGYGHEELGSIMYRVSAKTKASLERRLGRLA